MLFFSLQWLSQQENSILPVGALAIVKLLKKDFLQYEADL